MSSGSSYYLRIKTVDSASNLSSSTWQPFIYKFDSTIPTNPTTVVATPPGYSATDSFSFSWSGAEDYSSGISAYCYKTGASDSTDTCTSDSLISGITSYKSGANTFYVRTKDAAGNYSNDYVTASYYYSSSAPGAAQNLEVDPSNTVNAYVYVSPETYLVLRQDYDTIIR
jgi:hypothetical protein